VVSLLYLFFLYLCVVFFGGFSPDGDFELDLRDGTCEGIGLIIMVHAYWWRRACTNYERMGERGISRARLIVFWIAIAIGIVLQHRYDMTLAHGWSVSRKRKWICLEVENELDLGGAKLNEVREMSK